MQQMSWFVTVLKLCYIRIHFTNELALETLILAWAKEMTTLGNLALPELRVASRSCRKPPGLESSVQLLAGEKSGITFLQSKRNTCQQCKQTWKQILPEPNLQMTVPLSRHLDWFLKYPKPSCNSKQVTNADEKLLSWPSSFIPLHFIYY